MSDPAPSACAILLAGGTSARMQGAVDDKILHTLGGKPLWRHSLDAFLATDCIQSFVIVHRDDSQKEAIEKHLPANTRPHFTPGGPQRQDSVWAGLQAVPPDTRIVLIHDCARPLIAPSSIIDAIKAAHETGAACFAHKTTDTIKRVTPAGPSYRLKTIDRAQLWSMETPQVFAYSLIKDAYQNVIQNKLAITDDLSAIESSQIPVAFIENPIPNVKLTTPQDLGFAACLFEKNQP